MKTNSYKNFYDDNQYIDHLKHASFVKKITSYFEIYKDRPNLDLECGPRRCLELVVCNCELAINVSNCQEVVVAHNSSKRISAMIAESDKYVTGETRKTVQSELNFNEELPFKDDSFSAILFETALHHLWSIWKILIEYKRYLEQGDILIAQRLLFLSLFRANTQLNNLLKTPEVAASVSGNKCLKEQYEYYIQGSGFSVEFLKTSSSRIKSILKPLNGYIFFDRIYYCKKLDD